MSDYRFTRLRTDPRFRKYKRKQFEVATDERFKSKFTNDKGNFPVEKHRKINSKNHLEVNSHEAHHSKTDDLFNDVDQRPDLARGEVVLESSEGDSSSDEIDEAIQYRTEINRRMLGDEEDDLSIIAKEVQHGVDLNEVSDIYPLLDAEAAAYVARHPIIEGSSRSDIIKSNRLAIVNLDWERIRASHIYEIVSSLVSPFGQLSSSETHRSTLDKRDINSENLENARTKFSVIRGHIHSVCIYTSDFGKERMRREEIEGPPKELFISDRTFQDDSGQDEYIKEALRRYQLDRLRYFYAIIVCDTADVAAYILSELDGTELERTANVFDISLVPDGMTFDDKPIDEANSKTVVSFPHTAFDFATDALCHSKVTITWDEDNPERHHITRRSLTRRDIEKENFESFIASSSDDSADEETSSDVKLGRAERDRLREVLLGSNDRGSFSQTCNAFNVDKDNGDMEIIFTPGLSTNIIEPSGEKSTLGICKRKRKELRAQKKAKMKPASSVKKVNKLENDNFFMDDSSVGSLDDRSLQRSCKKRIDGTFKNVEFTPFVVEPGSNIAAHDIRNQMEHFDLKQIMKEQKFSKQNRRRKFINDSSIGDIDILQKGFAINTRDKRFKAIHEDHAFAIDPNNSHFRKTKDMVKFMQALTRDRKDRYRPAGFSVKDD